MVYEKDGDRIPVDEPDSDNDMDLGGSSDLEDEEQTSSNNNNNDNNNRSTSTSTISKPQGIIQNLSNRYSSLVIPRKPTTSTTTSNNPNKRKNVFDESDTEDDNNNIDDSKRDSGPGRPQYKPPLPFSTNKGDDEDEDEEEQEFIALPDELSDHESSSSGDEADKTGGKKVEQESSTNPKKRKLGEREYRDIDILYPVTKGGTVPRWVPEDRVYSEDLTYMLTQEINDFIDYISPTDAEHNLRLWVVNRIERLVKQLWPNAEAVVFGSFETKLYLPTSDIDIVVMCPSAQPPSCLYRLANLIEKEDLASKMEVIAKARVPIIKMTDKASGFPIDISFNVDSGIAAATFVKSVLSDPAIGSAVKSLVLFFKHFLSQRHLNEVYSGGIGSYAIMMMVVNFLKLHPKLSLVSPPAINARENLGPLLLEFLELFGKNFNYDTCGLGLDSDQSAFYYNKQQYWQRIGLSSYGRGAGRGGVLSIMDPCDPSNDVGKASYAYYSVRSAFMQAYNMITILLGTYYQRLDHYRTRSRPISRPKRPFTILGLILSITPEQFEHRERVEEAWRELNDSIRDDEGNLLKIDGYDDEGNKVGKKLSKKERRKLKKEEKRRRRREEKARGVGVNNSDDEDSDAEGVVSPPLTKAQKKELKKEARRKARYERKERKKKNRLEARSLEAQNAAIVIDTTDDEEDDDEGDEDDGTRTTTSTKSSKKSDSKQKKLWSNEAIAKLDAEDQVIYIAGSSSEEEMRVAAAAAAAAVASGKNQRRSSVSDKRANSSSWGEALGLGGDGKDKDAWETMDLNALEKDYLKYYGESRGGEDFNDDDGLGRKGGRKGNGNGSGGSGSGSSGNGTPKHAGKKRRIR